MSLDAAANIATVLGLPFAAVPVGLIAHGAVQSIRPKSKLKKWEIRIDQITAVVDSKGDMLTAKEKKEFLKLLANYKKARDLFRQKIKDGACTWYKGKGHADVFSGYARETWDNGLFLSTEASTRSLTRKARSNSLNDNAQPSVVLVPTKSTSLLNKGKSRQASSLSEESPLKNEPHSLDTAKSSEPSTGMSDSSSCQCLPNELPPSTSLPPLYSEADLQAVNLNNSAISVNSEDDAEDDSGSDSESNDIAPEEVEAVYNLWRQMPEEQSPWASTASLLDKLRGLMIRQMPHD